MEWGTQSNKSVTISANKKSDSKNNLESIEKKSIQLKQTN